MVQDIMSTNMKYFNTLGKIIRSATQKDSNKKSEDAIEKKGNTDSRS